MFTTSLLLILLIVIKQIDARTFHLRHSDSLTIMREKCGKDPLADECTGIKSQMEDLLRKCNGMASPISACQDVRSKYCTIWSRELYCSISGGGSITPIQPPPSTNDPDWYQIPSSSIELKSRGEYCVTHQSEQKCRNLMNALRIRYEECAKLPKTDPSCQSFKLNLCSAFPKFSPCLNGSSGLKRRATRLEHLLRIQRKVSKLLS